MKTNKRFWSCVAQFFLEWEMFQTRVLKNIKTHILYSITFFFKSYRLWDNVEKYLVPERPGIYRMRIARMVPKVTYTHSEYVILIK